MHPISSRHAIAVVQAAAKERLSDPVRGYPKEFEEAVYRELAELHRTRTQLMAVTPTQALQRVLALLGRRQQLGAQEERQPAPPRLTVTACGMATKIALGALATTLAVSAAIPALAGKPDNALHSGQQAQKQGQDVSAAGKRKRNKSKAVKKTFSNADAIAMPAPGSLDDFGPAAPFPSPIAVSGFKKATITDLNLTLRGFSHTFPLDVNVLLVAPGGRNAVVLGDVGGLFPVADLNVTLDDEAGRVLSQDGALTTGSFQPLVTDSPVRSDFPSPAPEISGNVALSTFDGINPNGEWLIFIVDDGARDTGNLADGWTLEITAKSKVKNRGRSKKRR